MMMAMVTLFCLFKLFQFTEEKLGQAEKTDYDAPFEMLLDRAEKTRNWTEKIMKQTETVLTPNPSELREVHYLCLL